MSNHDQVTQGSGNVFADLGLENADELLVKADLAISLTTVIRARGWNQREAAEALGVDQPKISALTRGVIGGFSVERLLRFLNHVGYDVDISVRPTASDTSVGRTRVTAATELDGQWHGASESREVRPALASVTETEAMMEVNETPIGS